MCTMHYKLSNKTISNTNSKNKSKSRSRNGSKSRSRNSSKSESKQNTDQFVWNEFKGANCLNETDFYLDNWDWSKDDVDAEDIEDLIKRDRKVIMIYTLQKERYVCYHKDVFLEMMEKAIEKQKLSDSVEAATAQMYPGYKVNASQMKSTVRRNKGGKVFALLPPLEKDDKYRLQSLTSKQEYENWVNMYVK